MINTTNTTPRPWETLPTSPAMPAETQADLVIENANLRQENTELHERLGAQQVEFEQLQKRHRRLRLNIMKAQGAASLLLAILSNP